MFSVKIHNISAIRRKVYEDYAGYKTFSDGSALVVLADGMGGTDCARDAATMAVDTILNSFKNATVITNSLRDAVLQANEQITNECLTRKCKMGCAIVVVYFREDMLWYVSLGNVHITLCSDNDKKCINQDDVYVASNGNVFLTRSLSGKNLSNKVYVNVYEIKGVNKVVLSTDGAYNHNQEDDATEVIVEIKS